MEKNFLDFCNSTKHGSTTATNKTVMKIFNDLGLYTKDFDKNRCDIELNAYWAGSKTKTLTLQQFNDFLNKRGPNCKLDIEHVKKRLGESGPSTSNTTAAAKNTVTSRLTDTSKYTGAHKERFDESGKGKGIDGRVDRDDHAASGYVGGYKNDGTYEDTH